MEGFTSKQTIVKMLDSENEEDQVEIDKNKKLIKFNQRCGANAGNANPKVKKRVKVLPWVFDCVDNPERSNRGAQMQQRSNKSNRPASGVDRNYGYVGSCSPSKRKFAHQMNQKRFASNTLRYS